MLRYYHEHPAAKSRQLMENPLRTTSSRRGKQLLANPINFQKGRLPLTFQGISTTPPPPAPIATARVGDPLVWVFPYPIILCTWTPLGKNSPVDRHARLKTLTCFVVRMWSAKTSKNCFQYSTLLVTGLFRVTLVIDWKRAWYKLSSNVIVKKKIFQ